MSILIDTLNEQNAIKVAANMKVTLDSLESQLHADALVIEHVENLLVNVNEPKDIRDVDLIELYNARARTKKNIERKAIYKIEFPKQKALISDTDIKSEIDGIIESL